MMRLHHMLLGLAMAGVLAGNGLQAQTRIYRGSLTRGYAQPTPAAPSGEELIVEGAAPEIHGKGCCDHHYGRKCGHGCGLCGLIPEMVADVHNGLHRLAYGMQSIFCCRSCGKTCKVPPKCRKPAPKCCSKPAWYPRPKWRCRHSRGDCCSPLSTLFGCGCGGKGEDVAWDAARIPHDADVIEDQPPVPPRDEEINPFQDDPNSTPPRTTRGLPKRPTKVIRTSRRQSAPSGTRSVIRQTYYGTPTVARPMPPPVSSRYHTRPAAR